MFQERERFVFNIVVPDMLSKKNFQEIQDSPTALRDLWLPSFANETRVGFQSHLPSGFSLPMARQGIGPGQARRSSARKEQPAQVLVKLVN